MNLGPRETSIRPAMRELRLAWGVVLMVLILIVWARTLAHADDQLMGMATSKEVIGKPVVTLEGKNLGTIKDLVINWRSDGYIEYAVVSFGGFWGLGVDYMAVPWEALTPSDNHEHFMLNVKESRLKGASGFAAYRFYDRSSVAILRAGRSPVAQSARVMKGDIGSDVNGPVARKQYAMEEQFHR